MLLVENTLTWETSRISIIMIMNHFEDIQMNLFKWITEDYETNVKLNHCASCGKHVNLRNVTDINNHVFVISLLSWCKAYKIFWFEILKTKQNGVSPWCLKPCLGGQVPTARPFFDKISTDRQLLTAWKWMIVFFRMLLNLIHQTFIWV